MKKIISLLPLFCLLCGCYPYTEIENTDILTSLYANTEEGAMRLSGGIANVRSFSDSMAENPVSLLSADGNNLESAVTHFKQSADHELFFGALRAMILGEELAKADIQTFLHFLDAQPRLRRSTAIFVTDSSFDDLIAHKAVNDFSGGFAAESILTTLDELGEMRYTSIGDVLQSFTYTDAGYTIPHITIENDAMRIDGYCLFTGKKAVGFTDSPAVAFFTMSNASQQHIYNGTPLTASLTGKTITTEVQDNHLHITAKLSFDLRQGKGTDTLMPERRAQAAKQIRARLEKEVYAALVLSRDTGCDFLELYKWRLTQGRADFDMQAWNELIKDMTFDVYVELK